MGVKGMNSFCPCLYNEHNHVYLWRGLKKTSTAQIRNTKMLDFSWPNHQWSGELKAEHAQKTHVNRVSNTCNSFGRLHFPLSRTDLTKSPFTLVHASSHAHTPTHTLSLNFYQTWTPKPCSDRIRSSSQITNLPKIDPKYMVLLSGEGDYSLKHPRKNTHSYTRPNEFSTTTEEE